MNFDLEQLGDVSEILALPPPPTDRFPDTDLANAERLVSKHRSDLRYCWGRGWHRWDGRRWAADARGFVFELAAETVRSILGEVSNAQRMAAEAGAERPPTAESKARQKHWTERAQRLLHHARSSEGAPRLKAMVDLARSQPPIAAAVEDLDRDPWLLNVENGTLDLRTVKLKPHDPDDLITKLSPSIYRPDAKAPRWAAFLAEILPDVGVRSFLQRFIGYSLTGLVRDHVIVVFFGCGSNGKTTLIETVLTVLGDYGSPVFSGLLQVPRGGDGHPTELADLLGLRLATVSELPDGCRLDEARAKNLSGGDRLRARFMRNDFFSFRPSHKIVLSTNYRPRIAGTDEGLWRRIRLVPFDVQIPEGKRDTGLPEKLRDEASGILAWAVEGCLEWQRVGLSAPAAVLSATGQYRAAEDSIGRFVAEACDLCADAETTAKDLRARYESWAEDSGESVYGPRKLAEHLRVLGCQDRKGGRGARTWRGIALAE